MKYKDKAAWTKAREVNAEDYGKAILDYAEAWADLMEIRMDLGYKVADVAQETSNEANTDGITGFMYGCAVAELSRSWLHGDELRTWHNLKHQIGNEGEEANRRGHVLNPALINIRQESNGGD